MLELSFSTTITNQRCPSAVCQQFVWYIRIFKFYEVCDVFGKVNNKLDQWTRPCPIVNGEILCVYHGVLLFSQQYQQTTKNWDQFFIWSFPWLAKVGGWCSFPKGSKCYTPPIAQTPKAFLLTNVVRCSFPKGSKCYTLPIAHTPKAFLLTNVVHLFLHTNSTG